MAKNDCIHQPTHVHVDTLSMQTEVKPIDIHVQRVI